MPENIQHALANASAMYTAAVLVVLLIAYIVYRKKHRRHDDAAEPATSTTPKVKPWIYMDDWYSEGNGPQDWVNALAMGKHLGNLLLMGATSANNGGTHLTKARTIVHAAGRRTKVVEGAIHYGPYQGVSPLAREIIDAARHFKHLNLCVGGPITDVAIALRQAPDIGKYLHIYALWGWNAKQDPESARIVKSRVKSLTTIDGDEWKVLVKGKSAKYGWDYVNTWYGWNPELRKLVLAPKWINENIRNNAGQLGVATPWRAADVLSIFMMEHGKAKAMKQSVVAPELTVALANLRGDSGG